MAKLKFSIIIVILVLGLSIPGLQAEETKVSGSAYVDVMSNYVWRGQKLSNTWVVQPAVGITYKGFGINLWSNYDSDRVETTSGIDTSHGEVTETDITLSYGYEFKKLSLSAGYIYYALESANDTQEVYLSVAYDTILNPALAIYYDYDEGNGAFIVASLGHSLGLSKDITLNLGASVSYNLKNKIMGTDISNDEFSNFYNGELSVSLSIPIWKSVNITPKLAYSVALSNDATEALRKISDDGDHNVLYGGVGFSISY